METYKLYTIGTIDGRWSATQDASEYGTTIFDVENEGRRLRYYWITISDGKQDVALLEYVLNGSMLDFDNWEPRGRIIEAPLISELGSWFW